VRAQAALTLLRTEKHTAAMETLCAMAANPSPEVRARALDALGQCGDASAFGLALSALDDTQPSVRKAASEALARLDPHAALGHLIPHLNDDNISSRRALAASLGIIGEPALDPIVEALSNPALEDGALMALEYLPAQKARMKIRAHAQSAAQTGLHYYGLGLGMAQKYGREAPGDGRVQLLMESLSDKGRRSGLNALRAIGLLVSREAVAVAVENLRSRNALQRANALETLEAVGEREIIRPLLVLWESGEALAAPLGGGWLMDLLDDPYAWLRACAVLVAAQDGDAALREKLITMSRSDPDEIVRAAAENVLLGGSGMDTLTTLSLMERILFLRKVPLFAGLSPADLKQVSLVTSEVLFSDGQVISRQGEVGTEMYVIVSGEIRVLITADNQKEPHEVACRRSGDCVGEMSVINQEPRIATLVASGAVRALCIRQKQFEGILRERPEISLALMRTLSQRLKEASTIAFDIR
jgi:HEAT repeat protein